MKKLLAAVITVSMVLPFAVMPAYAATLPAANKVTVTDVGLQGIVFGRSAGNVTITESDKNEDGITDRILIYNDKNITGGAIKKDANFDSVVYSPSTESSPKYVYSRICACSGGSGASQNNPIIAMRFASGSSKSADAFQLSESNGISCADSASKAAWRTNSSVDWNNRNATNTIDLIFDVNGSMSGTMYMFVNGKFIGWYYDGAHEHTEFYGYAFRFPKDKEFSSNGTFEVWFDTEKIGHTEYYDTDSYTVTLEDVLTDLGLSESVDDEKIILTSSDVARYMPNTGDPMKYMNAGIANSNVTYSNGVTKITDGDADGTTVLADMLKGFYPLNRGSVGGKYMLLSFDQKMLKGTKIGYRLGGESYPSTNSIEFSANSDGYLVSGVQGAAEHGSDANKEHESIEFVNKVHIDWIIDLKADDSYVDDYLYINGSLSQTGRIYGSNLLRGIGIYANGDGENDADIEISDWSMTLYNDTATMNDIIGKIKSGKLASIEDYKNNVSYFCDAEAYNALSGSAQQRVLSYVDEMLSGVPIANYDSVSAEKVENAFRTAILIEKLNGGEITEVEKIKTETFESVIPLNSIDDLSEDGKKALLSSLSKKDFASASDYIEALQFNLFENIFSNSKDESSIDKETFFNTYCAQIGYDVATDGVNAFCNTKDYNALTNKEKAISIAKEYLSTETVVNDYASFIKVGKAVNVAVMIESLNEGLITAVENIKPTENSAFETVYGTYLGYITANGVASFLEALSQSDFKSVSEYETKFNQALFLNVLLNAKEDAGIDIDAFFDANLNSAGFTLEDHISEFFKNPTNDIIDTIKTRTHAVFQSYLTTDEATAKTCFEGLIKAKSINTADKKAFIERYGADLGIDLNVSGKSYSSLKDYQKEEVITKLAIAGVPFAAIQTKLDEICDSVITEAAVSPAQTTSGGGGGGGGSSNARPTSGVSIINASASGTSQGVGGIIPGVHFTDMAEYAWATTAVQALRQKGIISGYSEMLFMPQNSVTRAEFISMMVRAYMPEVKATGDNFSDISSKDWFYDSVMAAFSKGIISGVTDTEFMPNQEIKRQDMAVILYNLAEKLGKLTESTSGDFIDGADVSEYAKTAVSFLKAAEVVKGDENGAFNPQSFANRAEAAQMIYTFIQFAGEEVLK